MRHPSLRWRAPTTMQVVPVTQPSFDCSTPVSSDTQDQRYSIGDLDNLIGCDYWSSCRCNWMYAETADSLWFEQKTRPKWWLELWDGVARHFVFMFCLQFQFPMYKWYVKAISFKIRNFEIRCSQLFLLNHLALLLVTWWQTTRFSCSTLHGSNGQSVNLS